MVERRQVGRKGSTRDLVRERAHVGHRGLPRPLGRPTLTHGSAGFQLVSRARQMLPTLIRLAGHGHAAHGDDASSEKPTAVRVITSSSWLTLPTGRTSRPPTLSCCLSGSGTRAGAAVTMMASKGAASASPDNHHPRGSSPVRTRVAPGSRPRVLSAEPGSQWSRHRCPTRRELRPGSLSRCRSQARGCRAPPL